MVLKGKPQSALVLLRKPKSLLFIYMDTHRHTDAQRLTQTETHRCTQRQIDRHRDRERHTQAILLKSLNYVTFVH